MRALIVVVASLAITVMGAGCSGSSAGDSTEDEDDDTEWSEEALKRTSLKFEGTCAFLHNCSSFSKHLPLGKVSWGCDGVETCDDAALWVAGPNRTQCGRRVKICRGTACTIAKVKDVSVSHDWEASEGVLDALDLPHGLTGKCSGFGGGSVSITRL